jgi:hypothetical protein
MRVAVDVLTLTLERVMLATKLSDTPANRATPNSRFGGTAWRQGFVAEKDMPGAIQACLHLGIELCHDVSFIRITRSAPGSQFPHYADRSWKAIAQRRADGRVPRIIGHSGNGYVRGVFQVNPGG